LFYVAFAFSGYNAAIYAAEELRSPRHTLPRALLIGCSAVGVLYLLINWEFISNLTPKRVSAVFAYEETRVTLAHLIASDLFGKTGGRLVSFLLIVVFCSAASAMSFLGPRVVSEMAKDGFLPGALAARGDGPPRGAVLLQAMLALVILWTQPFQHVVHDVGAILTLFSALTLLGLFRRRPRVEQSSIRIHRVAAAVFIASAAGMLYYGFRAKTQLVLWICAVAGAALLGYWGSRAAKRPIR
jgi:APA family basic amino acid/polyamine antiporter